MRKRRTNNVDPRTQTRPGHYLKNTPWRKEFVEEFNGPSFSVRDTAVLAFLVLSFVAVATTLWMNPPRILSLHNDAAIKGQATLAGHRVARPYNGTSYEASQFEEVKDDDPMMQDDLDASEQDVPEEKPTQNL